MSEEESRASFEKLEEAMTRTKSNVMRSHVRIVSTVGLSLSAIGSCAAFSRASHTALTDVFAACVETLFDEAEPGLAGDVAE